MNITNLIKGLLRWAIVTAISTDDQDFPKHQVSYLGKESDAIAWHPYGIHSNPGAEVLGLIVSLSGNSENKVILPGSPKERLHDSLPTPLGDGEILIYNPKTHSYVHFLASGSIAIVSKDDLNITVTGDANINSTGTTIITASAIELGSTITKLCNEAFLTFFNSHTHSSGGSGPPSSPAVVDTHTTVKTRAE
jgi:phage gp45-like